MHFSTTTLAVLATANVAYGAFQSLALRSASPIQYLPIQARDLGLWVGGKVTAFAIADGSASMDTEVPGGQQLFVGPKGSFRYTEAHSGLIPKGSYTKGFKNIPGKDHAVNTWTFTGGGATGLFACPEGKDKAGDPVYKLYANVKGSKLSKKCLEMDALRDHYKGVAAWQYE